MDSMDSIEPQKEREDSIVGDGSDSQLLAESDLCGVPRNGGGRESGGGGDSGGDGGGDEANNDEGGGKGDDGGDLGDRGKHTASSADDPGSVKESDDGTPDEKGCSSPHLSVRILPVFRTGQNERGDGKAGCDEERREPPSFEGEGEGDWEGKCDNESDDDDVFDLPPPLEPCGGVEDRGAFNDDEYLDNRGAFNDNDVDAEFVTSEHWDEQQCALQQWDRSYSSAHVNPRHPTSPVPYVDDETSASSPSQTERRRGASGDGGGEDGGGDEVKNDEASGHGTSISRSPRNRSNRSNCSNYSSPSSPSSPPALEDTAEISRRLDMGNMSSEALTEDRSYLFGPTPGAAVTTVIDVEGSVSSGYNRLTRTDSFDTNAHISSYKGRNNNRNNHTYRHSSHHNYRDPRNTRNSHGNNSHGDNHWNSHGNNSHGENHWNSHGNGDGHWRHWEYGVDGPPDTAVTCACGAEYGSEECFREDATRHRSESHDFRMGIEVGRILES